MTTKPPTPAGVTPPAPAGISRPQVPQPIRDAQDFNDGLRTRT